jgi:hypothetical protein
VVRSPTQRGDRAMCSLHFLCPLLEREFEAGFEVDEDTLKRHRYKLVVLNCPWCDRTHRFKLADGIRQKTTDAAQPLGSRPSPRVQVWH